jgi:hypothetical protein
MATTHCTSADGEAKSSTPIASLRYRVNCSRQIRRKTTTPEATILFFSFMMRTSSTITRWQRRNKKGQVA